MMVKVRGGSALMGTARVTLNVYTLQVGISRSCPELGPLRH